MFKIRLVTRDGEILAENSATFLGKIRPDVIRWGHRLFVLDSGVDGFDVYREAYFSYLPNAWINELNTSFNPFDPEK